MADSKYFRFPAQGDEEALVQFRDRHFTDYSTYRDVHLSRIARNLYYELGRQWIEQDIENSIDGARGFAFKEIDKNAEVELPRPVTNYIAPAIDVEFATLAKRQWTPKVVTYSRDPRAQAAAKVADDVLNDRMEKLLWPDLRDRFIRQMIGMGTAIIKSFWDESFYETSWVAVPNPMGCINPMCNAVSGTPQPACPKCGSAMAPINLSPEDSKKVDVFGQPLGQEVPKGNTNIEIISPFDYFPENGGIVSDRNNVRVHGIAKVRSLDWVEEHYPHLADQVDPESPEELMQNHPLLGDWNILGRFDHGLDAGIYDHHVRVFELYCEPTYRFKKGRKVAIIGTRQNLVAEDGDLVVEIADDDGSKVNVPKVLITSAVWKDREGEFWGKALPDDLISPQNRVNGMDAQIVEARERMGSPNLIIPEDADLQGPEFRQGYGLGKLFRYAISALNPQAKPEVFGSILMPSGVNLERDACINDMTKIIGPADIEIGEAPRNITTTSGLQILGEQAERRRATRERGIVTAIEKIWQHQLQLLWVLRVDNDTYEAKTPDGAWEMREFTGEAIGGQTKVKVEKQAYIDRSILLREATREAMVDGLYDASTPMARKKILENMGLPSDINEDSNLQIDQAKRMWVDFVDDGLIPVIDPSIDNPMIRFQTLGTMLLQDEGKRLANAAGWQVILPLIAGWEEDLNQLEMQDQMVRQFYGGVTDPKATQELFAQATIKYQEDTKAFEQGAQASAQLGQPNPVMPPQPPPEPVFIPRQIERRIFAVWQKLIQQNGMQEMQQWIMQNAMSQMIDPAALQEKVNKFLQFRSVVEGYRILSMKAAMPMQPPMPPAPASGPQSPQPQQPQQGPAGQPPMEQQ